MTLDKSLKNLTGLTVEAFKERARGKVAREVARDLGVNLATAKKYMKAFGLSAPPWRPPVPATQLRRSTWGVVSRFLADNPGVKLPYDTAEAAALVGCTPKCIRDYARRRRLVLERFAANLGDLRHLPINLTDVRGRTIPTSLITSYTLTVTARTYEVHLLIVLRGSHPVECHLPLKAYARLFGVTPDFPSSPLDRFTGAPSAREDRHEVESALS